MPKGSKIEDSFVSRQSLYLACEEMNFVWDQKEIEDFKTLWREGISVEKIGFVLNRDPDEVLLLAIDQSRNRMIKRRSGGLLGSEVGQSQPLVKAKKTVKGVVTVYEIDGDRYVLDNKDTYKGAKRK